MKPTFICKFCGFESDEILYMLSNPDFSFKHRCLKMQADEAVKWYRKEEIGWYKR